MADVYSWYFLSFFTFTIAFKVSPGLYDLFNIPRLLKVNVSLKQKIDLMNEVVNEDE